MGTPVIANDSGALPETVVHEKNGLIVRDNDIDAFVHHIHELRDDPDLYSQDVASWHRGRAQVGIRNGP